MAKTSLVNAGEYITLIHTQQNRAQFLAARGLFYGWQTLARARV
jgi:hypothetical protein